MSPRIETAAELHEAAAKRKAEREAERDAYRRAQERKWRQLARKPRKVRDIPDLDGTAAQYARPCLTCTYPPCDGVCERFAMADPSITLRQEQAGRPVKRAAELWEIVRGVRQAAVVLLPRRGWNVYGR